LTVEAVSGEVLRWKENVRLRSGIGEDRGANAQNSKERRELTFHVSSSSFSVCRLHVATKRPKSATRTPSSEVPDHLRVHLLEPLHVQPSRRFVQIEELLDLLLRVVWEDASVSSFGEGVEAFRREVRGWGRGRVEVALRGWTERGWSRGGGAEEGEDVAEG
jgi:hypothetical protein